MVREDKRTKCSKKKRKRKGFYGVRPQEKRDDLPSELPDMITDPDAMPASEETSALITEVGVESITSKKLLNTSFNTFESESGILTREKAREVGLGPLPNIEIAKGFKLQDATLLNDCISKAPICSSCRKASSRLALYQKNNERKGLSESLFLKCSCCGAETHLPTSRRLGGKGGGSHEVNRRAALASCQFGHTGLTQFCTTMNLSPPISTDVYQKHLIQIEKATKKQAEEVMNGAAERLRNKMLKEEPDQIEDGEDIIACVSVTVDGTWQKRGHSSKLGVVFVISVDTGEILDYEVKSLFCHECKEHTNWDVESEKYKQWKESHDCQINHKGSSEEMEAVAAVEIFSRSIEKRKLKYTTFVGDGDSSSFGRVKAALDEKFGPDYEIKKEECVGHVQKRLTFSLE